MSLTKAVEDERRSDSDDDRPLGQGIAAVAPEHALEARLAAIAFLRSVGRSPPPVVLGDYVVERSLGGGGFGRVYLARQPGLDRRVALKLLHPHRAHQGVEWLKREAHALAQLNHPNVVQVYHVGECAHGTFIVMEYVEGEALGQWQAGRTWRELLDVYRQAGLGLAAAHDRGVHHLDFKPSNVLVGADGRVRVADFGLASGSGVSTAGSDRRTDGIARVTGTVTSRAHGGTEGYASPEQVAGIQVDARSDQFSFCVALYEAMHGVLPFAPAEILMMSAQVREPPLATGIGRCPHWLARALRRGLRFHREARWPSMHALLDALAPPRWHRSWPGLAALGALVVGAPAALVGTGDRTSMRCSDVAAALAPEWHAERRAATEAAMDRAAAAWNPHLRATVHRALDRHAARVHDTALAACAEDQSLQTIHSCLARHRARFEDVLTLLETDPATLAANADRVVAEFGDPAACAVQAESAPSAQNGASETEVLKHLDAVRLELAAGRVVEAVARADQIVAAAHDVGTLAVSAEAFLVRGLVRDAVARDEEALVDLEESAILSLSIGRDDLAAESWRRAAWIAADDIGDLKRGQRWIRLARAATTRLGDPPLALAEQLDAEGLLLRLEGDPRSAEVSHRAALAQLDSVIDPGDPRWGPSWLLLANAIAEQGRAPEAVAFYEQALELARTRLGAQHPRVAMNLVARALVARDRARDGDDTLLRSAKDDLRRAIDILRLPQGADPALLSSALTLHAELALLEGRYDLAEALADEAWELQQRHLPERHSERGSALAVLARTELARGAWARSLSVHLELARARSEIDDDADLAAIDNNIGWLLCRLDRCVEAEKYYDRALLRGDPLQRAYAQSGRGQVSLSTGQLSEARARLETAMALIVGLGDSSPSDLLAETRWLLADARRRLGDDAQCVRELVDQALTFYREQGTDQHAIAELVRIRNALPDGERK